MAVEQWGDDGVMVAGKADDADDAGSADHAHLRFHPIECTRGNGHQVVAPHDAVGNHLRRQEVDAVQTLGLQTFGAGAVVGQFCELTCQFRVVLLQHQVASSQLLVDTTEGQVADGLALPLCRLPDHDIGRGQPGTALITIELEEEHEAHHFQ